MANTLGTITTVSDKARENTVLSYNTTLTSAATVANPILRILAAGTPLVNFLLDPTAPFLVGAVDGSTTLVFVNASVVAIAGTQTLPTQYQIIGRDTLVHLTGSITGATDAISVGQTVSAGTITVTAPAS